MTEICAAIADGVSRDTDPMSCSSNVVESDTKRKYISDVKRSNIVIKPNPSTQEDADAETSISKEREDSKRRKSESDSANVNKQSELQRTTGSKSDCAPAKNTGGPSLDSHQRAEKQEKEHVKDRPRAKAKPQSNLSEMRNEGESLSRISNSFSDNTFDVAKLPPIETVRSHWKSFAHIFFQNPLASQLLINYMRQLVPLSAPL